MLFYHSKIRQLVFLLHFIQKYRAYFEDEMDFVVLFFIFVHLMSLRK